MVKITSPIRSEGRVWGGASKNSCWTVEMFGQELNIWATDPNLPSHQSLFNEVLVVIREEEKTIQRRSERDYCWSWDEWVVQNTEELAGLFVAAKAAKMEVYNS